MSNKQKALILPARLAPFELGTISKPKIGPDEVLIKIMSVGLNPVDWKIQKFGDYFTDFPAIIGGDAAGYIEEVGQNVVDLKKGDRVLAEGLFNQFGGTFAEYLAVPGELAVKVPGAMSFDQAASIPTAVATAACGLYGPTETGIGLEPPWKPSGDRKYKGQGILICGGSSAVGQSVIQLAKLSGFHPIVTTASLHNKHLVESLGVTHVIDRRSKDVVSEIRSIRPGGYETVYDAISTSSTQPIGWNALTSEGALILVNPPQEWLVQEMANCKTKTVSYVYGVMYTYREMSKGLCAALSGYLESGKIKPNEVEIIPDGLAGIVKGLKMLEENLVSGKKLIVRPPETP